VQGSVYESLGEIQNLAWVGLGFPMASVAIILLIGRLYGSFDIKWLLISSIATFEVGSAVCGAAPTSAALVVGRVIAGAGGAGMYLGALTYVSVFTTPKEAPIYNALIGLSWGVGAILGPVVGGAFSVSSATWRWAFYINLPLAGLLSPVYLFMYPNYNPRPEPSFLSKLREIDWLGSVLNGAVLVLFMVAVNFGGSTYPWSSSASIALWAVWAVTLVAYMLQQFFAFFTTSDNRIFPIHFLRSRRMVLLFVATAGASSCMSVVLYYIPLFFQFTRGDSALMAAVRLLPFICVFIFFIMVAGATLPRVGRYNLYYLVAGALIVTGGALLVTVNEHTSNAHIYGYEILVAAGIGLGFQSAYSVAASVVQPYDKPNAIGFINVSQIGTTALALAIGGSLFQNLGFHALSDALASYHFPDDVLRSALAGTLSPVFTLAPPEVVAIAVTAVSGTIAKIFGMTIAGGAVVLVGAALMPWEKVELEM
jgi:MFS family permease